MEATQLQEREQTQDVLKLRSERYSSLISQAGLSLYLNQRKSILHDISETGFAILTKEPLLESTTHQVTLKSHDFEIFSGEARLVRKNMLTEENYVAGFKFQNQQIDYCLLEALEEIARIQKTAEQNASRFDAVDDQFKIMTFEIADYLGAIRDELNEIESKIGYQSPAERSSYEKAILQSFAPGFIQQFLKMTRELDRHMQPVKDRKVRRVYGEFFRKHVTPIYIRSPFMGRALTKPRGYAGDYELMSQIYRQQFEGPTLFDKIMHKYAICEPASESVRLRRGYLLNQIRAMAQQKQGPLNIASLACGPSKEVVDFLAEVDPQDSSRFTFILMDQDLVALQAAKYAINEKILKRGLNCQVHFLPVSVKQVIEGSGEAPFLNDYPLDLLYTAGLYDYLTQRLARRLTRKLYTFMNKDSLFIIGNFHPRNPTKTISEFACDWPLIHRNEEEMYDLVDGLEARQVHLRFDEINIDGFLEVRR